MSAFNGSGTFVITGTGLPYVTGTTISSTVANQLNTDLATGLSTTITKDGQSTPTAAIPFGTLGITTDKVNEFTSGAGAALKGTTANPATSASAGYVGEYISATGTNTSLTSTVTVNMTAGSIILTAGDWDVGGNITFGGNGATNVLYLTASVSATSATVSATKGDLPYGAGAAIFSSILSATITIPTTRVLITGNTTYYLVAQSVFATSTCDATAGNIWARRRR